MLRQRVVTGIFLGLAVVAAAFWAPALLVLLVLCAVCAFALWEFFLMLDAAGIPHFKWFGVFWSVVLVGATWFALVTGWESARGVEHMIIPVIVASVFLRQFPQKFNPRPLTTIAGTLLGILYVPFLFNFLTYLFLVWGDRTGRLLVLYLIVVVKLADIGAYTVGCSIGRHKLIPRVSPAKTWEGCAGAVAFATLGSVLYSVFVINPFALINLNLLHSLALGLILAVAGILGDLTESLFKRSAGIKDSGRCIYGMGGILDVIDSLLFAAPTLYVYLRFFVKG